MLAAQGVFGAEQLRRTVLLGELGLDGPLRPIRGILPATLSAQLRGFTRVVVPLRQAGEARLVEGIELFGIASITQLGAFLQGTPMPPVEPVEVLGERAGKQANRRLDLADVVGQVRRSGPARQPRPVAVTCSSTAHQWSARPCSPSVFRACSLILMSTTPLKCPRCIHLPVQISPTN